MAESPISMREFFRKAKEKGDIDLQKFAVLYLNADERMLNHIQMQQPSNKTSSTN